MDENFDPLLRNCEHLARYTPSVTNAISPPLLFDSEIQGRRPVGLRLRGPAASAHISTSICVAVVNKCRNLNIDESMTC